MAGTERIEAGPRQRLRPFVAGTIGLIAVIGVLMLSFLIHSGPACPATDTAPGRHTQPLRADSTACPARHSTSKGRTPADPPQQGR